MANRCLRAADDIFIVEGEMMRGRGEYYTNVVLQHTHCEQIVIV